jgi:hypothetical protein
LSAEKGGFLAKFSSGVYSSNMQTLSQTSMLYHITWGDREKCALVSAAGGPTSVEATPNRIPAINHIWSFSPERATWMDALGINQQNVTGHTQLGPLMTEIFAPAFKLLVWVGDEDDTSP